MKKLLVTLSICVSLLASDFAMAAGKRGGKKKKRRSQGVTLADNPHPRGNVAPGIIMTSVGAGVDSIGGYVYFVASLDEAD